MIRWINSGTSLLERFTVGRFLGTGSLGQVYEAHDEQSSKKCLLKVFRIDENECLQQYADYNIALTSALEATNIQGLVKPLASWQEGGFAYQALPYVDSVVTLQDKIGSNGPLDPAESLRILAQLAHALAEAHENSIIHGDVKPSNILLQYGDKLRVFLIDFGMMKKIGEEQTLVIGTYEYLHPSLRSPFAPRRNMNRAISDAVISHERLPVGAFVDIYALGKILLESLTKKNDIPDNKPDDLCRFLRSANPWLQNMDDSDVLQVADLIARMLSVPSDGGGISALRIAQLADELEMVFSEQMPEANVATVFSTVEKKPVNNVAEATVLEQLSEVADSIALASQAMISTMNHAVEIVAEPVSNGSGLLDEINTVFASAGTRTKQSWTIAAALTISVFVIIAAMVVVALTLILRGKNGWAMVFGGTSVACLIGTLLWRPFDRMFRATIVAQRLDMIHLRTLAVFRDTRSLDQRVDAIQTAMADLQTLMSDHAKPEPGPAKKGKKRAT